MRAGCSVYKLLNAIPAKAGIQRGNGGLDSKVKSENDIIKQLLNILGI